MTLNLNTSIEATLAALGATYYQTVPSEHKTYCALTAQVTAHALKALGFTAGLLECQVLYG